MNATAQISRIRDGGKGEAEDAMRRKTEKQGVTIYLKNTTVAVSVSVFSKNVAGGHFSISNPISLRDPVSVAPDCWSPLEPCDRAREGAAAPYWPFIWTHGGHIASL